MAENITSISNPSVTFTATKKLKSFFKKFEQELVNFKVPAPKNILDLNSNEKITLKVSDIEWLDLFLKHKREIEFSDFEPFSGCSLDIEIEKLLKNEKDLVHCSHNLRKMKFSDLYLHELLDTSTLILPKNDVIQRNPVLAARIEKLKKEQDERMYEAMTKNIDPTKKFFKEDTFAYEMNMMNRHLIAVGQFLLSVGAGFAFGFLGIELIVDDLEFGSRLLLGVACALIVAIADFYFLAKHLSEEEDAHSKSSVSTFRLNYLRGGKCHNE